MHVRLPTSLALKLRDEKFSLMKPLLLKPSKGDFWSLNATALPIKFTPLDENLDIGERNSNQVIEIH